MVTIHDKQQKNQGFGIIVAPANACFLKSTQAIQITKSQTRQESGQRYIAWIPLFALITR